MIESREGEARYVRDFVSLSPNGDYVKRNLGKNIRSASGYLGSRILVSNSEAVSQTFMFGSRLSFLFSLSLFRSLRVPFLSLRGLEIQEVLRTSRMRSAIPGPSDVYTPYPWTWTSLYSIDPHMDIVVQYDTPPHMDMDIVVEYHTPPHMDDGHRTSLRDIDFGSSDIDFGSPGQNPSLSGRTLRKLQAEDGDLFSSKTGGGGTFSLFGGVPKKSQKGSIFAA